MSERKNPTDQKSITVVENEIQQLDSQHLLKIFEPDENSPENLCLRSAQQLSNLAHSFMEVRERAYLENDDTLPILGSCTIDDIVKLSMAANEHMKTALVFKREKINALKGIK